MDDDATQAKVPAVAEALTKQLYIAAKAVRLHTARSSISAERAAALLAVLRAAQQRFADVSLEFTAEGITWDDRPVSPQRPAYAGLAAEFLDRGAESLRFHVGVTERELVSTLGLLLATPDEVREGGGFAARLASLGVVGITSLPREGGAAATERGTLDLERMRREARDADGRVRRNAIRGLAETPDTSASEALRGALADRDPGVARLAARALGERRFAPALPGLYAVAAGETPGGRRAMARRVEAVEAIGRIGSPDSLETLREMRRPSRLRSLRRDRTLATALDAAIARIETG